MKSNASRKMLLIVGAAMRSGGCLLCRITFKREGGWRG